MKKTWIKLKNGIFDQARGVYAVIFERYSREADIDLMTAAPDMLEALRAVEACMSPDDNDHVAQLVRAAIKKAEGAK